MFASERKKFVRQLCIAFRIGMKWGVLSALIISLYFLWLGRSLNIEMTFITVNVHENGDYQAMLRDADNRYGKGTEYGLEGFDYVYRCHYYTKPGSEFRIPCAVILCPLALITFFSLLFPGFILLSWAMPSD
jgi:hypothetical protein